MLLGLEESASVLLGRRETWYLDEAHLWQGEARMRARHHVLALLAAAYFEQDVKRPPEPVVVHARPQAVTVSAQA